MGWWLGAKGCTCWASVVVVAWSCGPRNAVQALRIPSALHWFACGARRPEPVAMAMVVVVMEVVVVLVVVLLLLLLLVVVYALDRNNALKY